MTVNRSRFESDLTENAATLVMARQGPATVAWLYRDSADADLRADELADYCTDETEILVATMPIRERFDPMDETPRDKRTMVIVDGHIILTDGDE